MMNDSSLLCVFAKPPVPGKVKTRLAAELGDIRAADLARAFLTDTWELASSATWARSILATTEGSASEFGLPGLPEIWLQGEGDLGAKLESIVRRGLAESSVVIAIGADSPGLPTRRLVEARDALATFDAVLGPSEDGGFYLVGLKHCPPGLFADLRWSEPTTFAATRKRLEQRGMRVRILPPWFDVDHPADLDRLRLALERGTVHASATAKALQTMSRAEVSCGST